MSFPDETQGRRETDKETMANSPLRASAPLREKSVWVMKRIGDCCDVLNGGTPKTGVAEYWDGEHAWVTPAEMGKRSSPYIDKTSRTLTNAGLENCSANPLPPNSVILSSRAPIGHLVINTVPMAFNQGCKGLVPKKELHHKFLYYFLYASVDLLNSLGTGATFKELSGGKLKDVEIPVPPLPEQERIVGILDEAFDGIAKAKATAEANLQNARALFQSHLQSVFSQQGEGWVEKRLGDVVTRLTNGYVGPTRDIYFETGVPYLLARHVKNNSLKFDGKTFISEEFNRKNKKSILKAGDVLLVQSGHIGHSAVVTSEHEGHNCHAMIVLTPVEGCLTGDFLSLYFNTPEMQQKFQDIRSGSTVPHLTCGAVKELKISIPDIPTQRSLVIASQAFQSETQRLESLYQNKLNSLDELKKSLLHQAFTGNL
jgi:type I restriction enzyme, S subunit